MRQGCFYPSIALVDRGESLTFANRDRMKHYANGMNGSWNTKVLRHRSAVEITFNRDGVYPYYCPFHWSMQGVIVVGDGRGPGPATKKGVEVEKYVRPAKAEPMPTPEPLIFHIPKTVEAASEPDLVGSAFLVWGGGAAGLVGGLLIHWASRRRSGEP